MKQKVSHEGIFPVYDRYSKILILGSIPSPKSREEGFYYAHPQNRFWKVLSDIFNETFDTIEDKKAFLLKYHIALFDVIKSCEIIGASDASISNIVVNDIKAIIDNSHISKIFVTGKKAQALYNKYCLKQTDVECVYLPSTSPANCAVKYDDLKKEYEQIKEFLS